MSRHLRLLPVLSAACVTLVLLAGIARGASLSDPGWVLTVVRLGVPWLGITAGSLTVGALVVCRPSRLLPPRHTRPLPHSAGT